VKDNPEETTYQERAQRRYALCNLQELYVAFHVRYPAVSIGFSKFEELHPEYCSLEGGKGSTPHVCVIYQNVTLTVQGAHLLANFNAKNLLEKWYAQHKVKHVLLNTM
jgi:hypothetical protein